MPRVEVFGDVLRHDGFVGFEQIRVTRARLRGQFECDVEELTKAGIELGMTGDVP